MLSLQYIWCLCMFCKCVHVFEVSMGLEAVAAPSFCLGQRVSRGAATLVQSLPIIFSIYFWYQWYTFMCLCIYHMLRQYS